MIAEIIIMTDGSRFSRGEMRAHEADAGGVEEQADGHAPFVARGAAHARFHRVHRHVPA